MNAENWKEIEEARKAAIVVLLHNSRGPFMDLPRTAGWGYPEPYTRDLMLSILGIAVTGNEKLLGSIRKVLETLAQNQTPRGYAPWVFGSVPVFQGPFEYFPITFRCR